MTTGSEAPLSANVPLQAMFRRCVTLFERPVSEPGESSRVGGYPDKDFRAATIVPRDNLNPSAAIGAH
jgi:hypothetical protein